MPASTLLTIDDYERLPAEVARHHELVNGELIEALGNTPRHNRLRDRIIVRMEPLISARNAGIIISQQEYDFGGNVHAPDVSVFCASKLPLLDNERRVQRFVPDLAIEIASPSDTYQGLLLKKDRYLKAGTAEVWLFAPETHEIAQHTQVRTVYLRDQGRLTSDLFPDIAIDIEEFFRGL